MMLKCSGKIKLTINLVKFIFKLSNLLGMSKRANQKGMMFWFFYKVMIMDEIFAYIIKKL